MTLKIKLMSITKPLLGSTNCYKSRLAKPVAKDQINISTDRKSKVSYPKKVEFLTLLRLKSWSHSVLLTQEHVPI